MLNEEVKIQRAKALLKHAGYKVIKEAPKKTKYCELCKKKFETNHPHQVYCSATCRYTHYQLL